MGERKGKVRERKRERGRVRVSKIFLSAEKCVCVIFAEPSVGGGRAGENVRFRLSATVSDSACGKFGLCVFLYSKWDKKHEETSEGGLKKTDKIHTTY